MRWRRAWPGRTPRPEARRLPDDEKNRLLAAISEEVAASPVLTGLGLRVRSQRGRFHLERPLGEAGADGVAAWGRITPLAESNDLLLEQERKKGNWSEIVRGSVKTLMRTVAGDTKGTFHGLGALDAALRQAGKGLERLPVERKGAAFVYRGTDDECSAQEALYHYFGLPLQVLVEPSEWYSYHRTPRIVETSGDRARVLVRFRAESLSGESFGGTCLYARREGGWGAYRLRPSESRDIATADAWLVKRKWKQWGS